MKNSIGSLAALAAFAAPSLGHATPAESDVRAANFENVTLSYSNTNAIDFDIDGDGTADFSIYGNDGNSVVIAMYDTTAYSPDLVANTVFDASTASETLGNFIFQPFDGYYGFSFVSGLDEQVHAAWVHFDFTGPTPLAVNGAWEAESFYSTITVGAIPEPSTVAALAGSGALLGALAFRRRRSA
ncbi:MAG TPA: PEP-CTERM sorting domain-containing protein [Rariglobus sp.]